MPRLKIIRQIVRSKKLIHSPRLKETKKDTLYQYYAILEHNPQGIEERFYNEQTKPLLSDTPTNYYRRSLLVRHLQQMGHEIVNENE